jgi:ribosomal protein L24
MSKLHIKKDDTVIVIAGADKGKTGKVLKVLVEENRAIVEGVHMVSKSHLLRILREVLLSRRLLFISQI